MLERKNDLLSCSLSHVFHAIGGKWKPYIIWYLGSSPDSMCRYGGLKRCIPWKISHKMFSQQLRELEDDGIIARQEYNEKIQRVEYSLTEKGKYLVPAIFYLRDWGVLFGEGFGPASLLRTQGKWEERSIHYEYTPDVDTTDMAVQITFNVGISKQELPK